MKLKIPAAAEPVGDKMWIYYVKSSLVHRLYEGQAVIVDNRSRVLI